MSVQVDTRAGSGPLIPRLRNLGMEVDACRLDFGDIAWIGNAQDGMPVSVGVECKSLSDLLSSLTSGRWSGHQLIGMLNSYDHCWLLLEGEWKARFRDGVLIHKRSNHSGGEYWAEAGGGQRVWMARDLESWLLTQQIMANIRVQRVRDWDEGCYWIRTVYNWYQKDFHQSHRTMYEGKHLFMDQALLSKPTLARRVAAQLPGVGDVRSASVAKAMHTLADMVAASPEEWAGIEISERRGGSKRLGMTVANKIYKAIHQNGNGERK